MAIMRRPLTYAVCAFVLLGCSDATAPTPVPGTWKLQTVDGRPLPFTLLTMGDYTYEITGWTVTLASDGSYSGSRDVRETQPTDIAFTSIMSGGTWTLSGRQVVLTEMPSKTTYTLSLGHDVMTYTETDPDPFTGVTTTFTMTFVRQ